MFSMFSTVVALLDIEVKSQFDTCRKKYRTRPEHASTRTFVILLFFLKSFGRTTTVYIFICNVDVNTNVAAKSLNRVAMTAAVTPPTENMDWGDFGSP